MVSGGYLPQAPLGPEAILFLEGKGCPDARNASGPRLRQRRTNVRRLTGAWWKRPSIEDRVSSNHKISNVRGC